MSYYLAIKEGHRMEKGTKYALFTGLGFLLGTAGVKAATSNTARKGYVYAMAQGMRARHEYESIVEEAKAEYDDMKAEASYLANVEAVEADEKPSK